jgi:TatD DNase family protein
MAMRLPDCCAHLDRFGNRVVELLKEWEAAGVAPVVSVGADLDTSQTGIDLAWQLRTIKAAVGLHPRKITGAHITGADLEPFGATASDPMVVAIGEVGLDTTDGGASLAVQRDVLAWFVTLAQQRGFPLILHLAAPTAELTQVWNAVPGRKPTGAVHDFSGSVQDARELLEHGLYLSLGPAAVGIIEGGTAAAELVEMVPDQRLLVDSGASPADGALPEVRPVVVAEVASRIAELRGVSVDRLTEQIGHNFTQLLKNHA